MGFARLAETSIRNMRGKKEGDKLGALDKILASSIGGALATWNQPIEGEHSFQSFISRVAFLKAKDARTVFPVVRVEMQSALKSTDPTRPAKKTVLNTLSYVYKENGLKGLYRGVTPRIGLGIWQTVN